MDNISIGFTLELVLLCCCAVSFIVRSYTIKFRQYKYKGYVLAYLFMLLLLFFEVVADYFDGIDGKGILTLLGISRFMVYFSSVTLLFLYTQFVLIYVKKTNKIITVAMVLDCIISELAVVLLIVSQFTGIVYYFDEANRFCIGNYHWLFNLVFIIVISGFSFISYMSENNKVNLLISSLMFDFMYIIITIFEVIKKTVVTDSLLAVAGIAMILLFNYIYMMQNLASQNKKVASLERDIKNIHTKTLVRQTSPHFIYNALTAIQMIEGNPIETKQAIKDFAKYLRSNLSVVNDNDIISFSKELEIIETYLKVEKLRFGDELKTEFHIGVSDFDIPSFSIQMLVENAVKHGVSRKRGGGTVKLITKENSFEYTIIVEDDGVGFDISTQFDDSHIGLGNVRNRLRMIVNGVMDIESRPGNGTKVTISIPKEN